MFNFIVGNEVYQIKVSRAQLVFELGDSITISVESEIILQSPKSKTVYQQGDFAEILEVLNLLGKKVISVLNSKDKLQISFSDSYVMTLQNSNNGYESFVITHDNQTYVV